MALELKDWEHRRARGDLGSYMCLSGIRENASTESNLGRDEQLASTVNMRSGFRTMGVLRHEGQASDEPVALETAVIATGARPGDASAKRELFTEETQTVLVFERGAVIRLSAAVADGQLLFLTNKKTGKEVVTQVVRKRSFRPTSCYVDLEFTEPSPGFWDIEFPKAAPVLPSQMANDSSDDEAGDAVKQAAPPDQQEVERLKKEVAELQSQLKTLAAIVPSGNRETAPTDADENSSTGGELARQQHEKKILKQLLAQEAQQEQLHGPQRLVAYPKKGTSSVVKAASKAATVAAFAAVLVAAGIAAYRFGLLDFLINRPTVAKPAPAHTSASANATAAQPAPKTSIPTLAPLNVAPTALPATPGAPGSSAAHAAASQTESGIGSAPTPVESLRRAETVPASTEFRTAPKKPKLRNGVAPNVSPNKVVGESASSAGLASSSGTAMSATDGTSAGIEDYVGPKLIRSVKPVSPPDVLRNYVTGNVNVDAVVDVTGHVKSVTVISGPEKLRSTAIEEMKQYIYEPARKNGKPVVSHVQTSLKYWYEP